MTARRPAKIYSPRGSALLTAMCFATVLAVALATYLTLCLRSLQMSTRNMNSSHSVELAELGMEDAVWSLNKSDWSTWTISGTTATKSISGFTYDNGATGAVSLTVANYNGASGTRTITVVGTTTLGDGTTTSRTLTSTSTQAALFTNAVAATTGLVKFTSAGTASLIDSYDSSLGAYSTTNAGYSAILSAGSTSTASNTVQLTNAQVHGYVATMSTGPSYSTSATLKGPTTSSGTRVDLTNRTSTSPYQPQFDLKTPSTTGATAFTAPALNTTKHVGTAGVTTVFTCTGFDMTGTGKIIIDGPIQIVMTGTAAFYLGLHGGTPQIQITSTGSLELFSAGDLAIYGGGISNATSDPKKCAIYSSNALTVPDMNTTTAYYGVIYTPSGDFTVASNNAIYGAIVARNVTFSGTAPVVHYDTNLRNVVFTGIDTPYALTNTREL